MATAAPRLPPQVASKLDQLEIQAALLESYLKQPPPTCPPRRTEVAETETRKRRTHSISATLGQLLALLLQLSPLLLWSFYSGLRGLMISVVGAAAVLTVLTTALLIIAPPEEGDPKTAVAFLFSSVARRLNPAHPHQSVRKGTFELNPMHRPASRCKNPSGCSKSVSERIMGQLSRAHLNISTIAAWPSASFIDGSVS